MHQELACWRATNGQRRRPKAWVGAGTGLRPAPLLRGLHIIFGPLKHQTVASKTVTTAGTRVATHNQGGYPRRPTDPFHETPSAITRHLAQSVGSSDTNTSKIQQDQHAYDTPNTSDRSRRPYVRLPPQCGHTSLAEASSAKDALVRRQTKV